MKIKAIYGIIIFALFSVSHAEAQFKIRIPKLPKIKAPKITISDPKITIGTPKIRIKDPLGNVATVVEKAGKDFTTTIRKAGSDTSAETGRTFKNIEEATVAIGKYTERQVKGYKEAIGDAEKRIREGKVVDALFHAALDPQLNTEENLAKATQESKLINTAAATAASAYGGPGGAAAYGAWTTYRKTGDADLAFRVGLITGVSNAGFALANKIPSNSFPESIRKAVVTGTIGGLAISASGGDEAAIRKGFLMAGGMVLVQDGFQEFTGHKLDPKGAKGEPYCMLANPAVNAACAPPQSAYVRDPQGNIIYENGVPKIDISKLDPERSYVGRWYKPGEKLSFDSDNHWFMKSVAKVPGMNALGLFHDQWAYSWDMNILSNVASITPAVVLTYMGTVAPINNEIQNTVIDFDIQLTHKTLDSEKAISNQEVPSYTIKDMFAGISAFASLSEKTLEEKMKNASIIICQRGTVVRTISEEDEGSMLLQGDAAKLNTPAVKLENPILSTKKPFDIAQLIIPDNWDCYTFLSPDEEL